MRIESELVERGMSCTLRLSTSCIHSSTLTARKEQNLVLTHSGWHYHTILMHSPPPARRYSIRASAFSFPVWKQSTVVTLQTLIIVCLCELTCILSTDLRSPNSQLQLFNFSFQIWSILIIWIYLKRETHSKDELRINETEQKQGDKWVDKPLNVSLAGKIN